jgi:hypothetical protein
LLSERRVAIVHPWVVDVRGGEKSFFALAHTLPHADLFLLHYRPGSLPPETAARVRGVSFLQRFPLRRATLQSSANERRERYIRSSPQTNL